MQRFEIFGANAPLVTCLDLAVCFLAVKGFLSINNKSK